MHITDASESQPTKCLKRLFQRVRDSKESVTDQGFSMPVHSMDSLGFSIVPCSPWLLENSMFQSISPSLW